MEDIKSQLDAAIAAINKIAEHGNTWMCPYCKYAMKIYAGMCDCHLGIGVCQPPFTEFKWRGGICGDSYYEKE